MSRRPCRTVVNGKYGLPSDVWDLGVIAHAMFFYAFPAEVEAKRPLVLPAQPDTLSSKAREFVSAMLCSEPCMRPRPSELLVHSFLNLKTYEECTSVWKGANPISFMAELGCVAVLSGFMHPGFTKQTFPTYA